MSIHVEEESELQGQYVSDHIFPRLLTNLLLQSSKINNILLDEIQKFTDLAYAFQVCLVSNVYN
jgi:hypothetical protein